MDTVNRYREIVREILQRYVGIEYANGDIDNETVFDEAKDRYALISVGWTNEPRRSHGCLIHIDIIDGKVWIQRDGTEDGVALELEEEGIAKTDIVLAWHPPKARPYTGYAAA